MFLSSLIIDHWGQLVALYTFSLSKLYNPDMYLSHATRLHAFPSSGPRVSIMLFEHMPQLLFCQAINKLYSDTLHQVILFCYSQNFKKLILLNNDNMYINSYKKSEQNSSSRQVLKSVEQSIASNKSLLISWSWSSLSALHLRPCTGLNYGRLLWYVAMLIPFWKLFY